MLPASMMAVEFHVAPSGSDSAAGTAAAPWCTLGHAASVAAAGDTVFLRAGTYTERVVFTRSGTSGAPIVFRSHPGETAVLDGSSLTLAPGWAPFLWLQGVSHVIVRDIEIRNLGTAMKNAVPIGILVTGSGAGVRLEGNFIHHIETRVTSSSGGDAHGIAVYGDAAERRVGTGISGNRLADLKLGSSEALVLNGNVDGFLVEDNTIVRCNNIGIDAIGHEGVSPSAADDVARNGIIRRNTVSDITSRGNPAYGQSRSAGGIYIDGGRDILVERNTVARCDIGIELASEHAGQGTLGILVRNNILHENTIGGIFLGGYDTRRGYTAGCTIEHNTLWQNDTAADGNGEILLQYDVRDTSLRHNVVAAGNQGLLVGHPFTKVTNVTFDHNLYTTPTGVAPQWQWKNREQPGLAAWRSATSQDANSRHAPDALLIRPAAGDFGLRPASPGRDLGDPSFLPAPGELDHAAQPRRQGPATDAGAREFNLAAYALPSPLQTVFSARPEPALTLVYGLTRDDISYVPEASDDLLVWTTNGITASSGAATVGGPADGRAARFLRLRVQERAP